MDLPAPDRPMMATNSPCSNLRLTSLRPLTPLGYVLETCLNSIKRGHFLFAMIAVGRGNDWDAVPNPAKNLRFLDFPLDLSLCDKSMSG